MTFSLSSLKMKYKLWLIIGVALLGMTLVMFSAAAILKDSLHSQKKIMTKNLVDSASSTVERYHSLAKDGKMNESEAKATALAELRSLRYEGNNYFWINDMKPVMIMHPIKPELDGKDLSAMTDPTGKKLFMEFVETVKKGKEGYVYYSWPKPGEKEPVKKLSFVKGFEPWGWIIGTGIYIEDVDKEWFSALIRLSAPTVLVGIVILLISWSVYIGITRPLYEIGVASGKIAKGDLSAEIRHTSSDELGHLAETMRAMVSSLRSLIQGIIAAEAKVAETTSALNMHASRTVEGTQSQSGQAAQIATAAEEMSQTINDIARSASAAAETSGTAKTTAAEGRKISEGAVMTVNRVSASTTELSSLIIALNTRVSEIGDIVTVIKDIADQTNLLALNAAIEAARAGEQGRGFSVVADEVRKLAERKIKATAEISDKIGAVRAESEETTKSMSEATLQVREAEGFIRRVGENLAGIFSAVEKIGDQITQIATAVDEQSAAAEDVSANIEKTSHTAREMEGMAHEVLQETSRMKQIASELTQATSGFRL